jgi:hypothetical protein
VIDQVADERAGARRRQSELFVGHRRDEARCPLRGRTEVEHGPSGYDTSEPAEDAVVTGR